MLVAHSICFAHCPLCSDGVQVVDLSWNANDKWVIATVADDNTLQVWQVADAILQEEDEEAAKDADPEDLE